MATRKPVQELTPEERASRFQDDFDNDFLNWKPGGIKSSLALDFEDDTPPSNAQRNFSISKLDMDIDFDAGFSKLMAFDIDMPFSDGSPPAKQKAAKTSTNPPKHSRRQPDNDMDMLFADKFQQKETSEAGLEVEEFGAVDAIMSEATNFSQEGQATSADFATPKVQEEDTDAVRGPEQDQIAKADNPQEATEEVCAPEEGIAMPKNNSAIIPVAELSQPRTDSSKDVDHDLLQGQTAGSGAGHSEEASSAVQIRKPATADEEVRRPTSKNLTLTFPHDAMIKTTAPSTNYTKLKSATEVSLRHLKLPPPQSSELLDNEVKEPDSKIHSICPDAELKGPKCALRLVSVKMPEVKVCKQRLANVFVNGGKAQLGSLPAFSTENGAFAASHKDAPVVTRKGKRKLSPKARSDTNCELEAKKTISHTRPDVPLRPQGGGASLDQKKFSKLQLNNLGISRSTHQESNAPSLLKQTRKLAVTMPKPHVLRGPVSLTQRSSYLTKLTRLSETKAPDQFPTERPMKQDIGPSVPDNNPQEHSSSRPTASTSECEQVSEANEDTNIQCREGDSSLALIQTPVKPVNETTSCPTPPAETDMQHHRQHGLPETELDYVCTDSLELAVRFELELNDMEKMLKSKHEALNDLLVRACILNTSWALLKNPMDELKMEIEEYIRNVSFTSAGDNQQLPLGAVDGQQPMA